MYKEDPEDLENVIFMHTLNKGTDFRIFRPESSSMSWDMQNVEEHPSREIQSYTKRSLKQEKLCEITIGLCEGQKRLFFLESELEAITLLRNLKSASK